MLEVILKITGYFSRSLRSRYSSEIGSPFLRDPFSIAEADAWWLGYDALSICDLELRAVDRLLDNFHLRRFVVKGVQDSGSPQLLSKKIETLGWTPVDARVRVSNVSQLVKMFGGEELYGDEPFAVVRELLQNASDAIRARRKRHRGLSPYTGQIFVVVRETHDQHWLDIVDNGIGMSERTMTESLLDFGNSFWSSSAVQREYPGLISSGLEVSGRFGIGFFSSFMLASVVHVTSKRFDYPLESARTLEFRKGLQLRPTLRKASPTDEIVQEGGTRVSLLLKKSPFDEDGILYQQLRTFPFGKVKTRYKSMAVLIAKVCPTLDVSVSTLVSGKVEQAVGADDWKEMDCEDLLTRLEADENKERRHLSTFLLRPLIKNGRMYGRACIAPYHRLYGSGKIVAKGFASAKLNGIDGAISGEVLNLARDRAIVLAPPDVVQDWATKQAELIASANMEPEDKVQAAGIVLGCGGDPGLLPVAQINGEFLSSNKLTEYLAAQDSVLVHVGKPSFEEYDDCHPRDFYSFSQRRGMVFLGKLDEYYGDGVNLWSGTPNFTSVLHRALEDAWGTWSENDGEDDVVGTVDGYEIRREVTFFARTVNEEDLAEEF